MTVVKAGWTQIGEGLYEREFDGRKYTARRTTAGATHCWDVRNAAGKQIALCGTLPHATMMARNDKPSEKPKEPAKKDRSHLRVIK